MSPAFLPKGLCWLQRGHGGRWDDVIGRPPLPGSFQEEGWEFTKLAESLPARNLGKLQGHRYPGFQDLELESGGISLDQKHGVP